jgi:hypothetical protein
MSSRLTKPLDAKYLACFEETASERRDRLEREWNFSATLLPYEERKLQALVYQAWEFKSSPYFAGRLVSSSTSSNDGPRKGPWREPCQRQIR